MQESEQAAFPVQDDSLGIGLTKREYAAIAIVAGLISRPESGARNAYGIAKEAIAIADELFDQLKLDNSPN